MTRDWSLKIRIHDLAKLGIAPGAEFSLSDFSGSGQDAIKDGYASGQAEANRFIEWFTFSDVTNNSNA